MSEQELARDLGFLEAYTLGLGTMIGAGIFVLPGIVAEAAGPASMVSFTIGGVVALLAALSLSELATGMPKAGGSYYYINHALGSFFGTIVGWGMWAGLMFATAFYMLGFGQYLLDQPSTAIGVVAAALVMAALLTLLNYRGVKETGSFQNIIVISLVGLILVFIAVGLPQVDPDLLQPFTAGQGWPAVGVTAGTVFVTFIGFEVIATSAEEIKQPGRNLPLAMVAAVVTPTLLYVLVMLVSTGVLPVPELAASDVPVADVARATAGALGAVTIGGFTIQFSVIGGGIMIIGAVLATISSANASILSAARVNFAMGRDKILADWLNQIHSKYRTPYRAILATGGVILALIASPLPIDTLADVAAFMFLVTYALVHIAVVVLRRAEPENYDPDFRIPSWGYPAIPIVGFFGCVVVLVQMGDTPLVTVSGVTLLSVVQAIGIGIILLSIGWWAYYARQKAISTTLVGEAVAPTKEAVSENEVYRVVVPIANPTTEQTLIRYAAASAYSHEGPTELIAVNVIEVPPQMSPEQIELEEERVNIQQDLLENAKETAETLDIPLRTRAIVGRNAGSALLSVIKEENADHVLMGWGGSSRRRDAIFGTTLDPVIERAPCEVTLVTNPRPSPGRIVALAGGGPNAPVAARRAGELTRTFENASLTLLNVQSPADNDSPTEDDLDERESPTSKGEAAISEVAVKAELEETEYDSQVIVSETVRETLIESVGKYDTVSVGATGQSFVAQTLYGSIPQTIVEESDGTVLISRDADRSPRTLREALGENLRSILEG
ncbi:amino acid permease [Natranaeroarchaeum aerophilus]|uniref:Amino acid permease n=1 Tax=Natranaeroarchaeum aerophilus TaxID=2917711 RepID=A0AAE3FU23_9EURY|nr:amino acid permease [Natranaeroarchaeum aerophilus]MCL9815206.1 amino acid permease [Natranaeroarchaeum aerophilus]